MCGCCCSSKIDYKSSYQYYYLPDENDLYSFRELDGEELKITYYYDFKKNNILRKNDSGKYYSINFIQTRKHGDGFSNTHAMLSAKNGKVLMYCHYSLLNKLKEAYHQNIRNKVREEVIKEISVSEPLITI